jgi:type II secretory pathway pseudopilin PulG
MAKLIKKKIEGATVIEVIIAMVIIMVVFVIAMKVFANVLNTGVSFRDIQVQNQLNVLSKKVEEQGYVENSLVQIDGVNYELIEKGSELKNISTLEIKATQQGKLIGKVKTLFRTKEHAED